MCSQNGSPLSLVSLLILSRLGFVIFYIPVTFNIAIKYVLNHSHCVNCGTDWGELLAALGKRDSSIKYFIIYKLVSYAVLGQL